MEHTNNVLVHELRCSCGATYVKMKHTCSNILHEITQSCTIINCGWMNLASDIVNGTVLPYAIAISYDPN